MFAVIVRESAKEITNDHLQQLTKLTHGAKKRPTLHHIVAKNQENQENRYHDDQTLVEAMNAVMSATVGAEKEDDQSYLYRQLNHQLIPFALLALQLLLRFLLLLLWPLQHQLLSTLFMFHHTFVESRLPPNSRQAISLLMHCLEAIAMIVPKVHLS